HVQRPRPASNRRRSRDAPPRRNASPPRPLLRHRRSLKETMRFGSCFRVVCRYNSIIEINGGKGVLPLRTVVCLAIVLFVLPLPATAAPGEVVTVLKDGDETKLRVNGRDFIVKKVV